MQRIIFLDIDGPVISTPQHFMDYGCATKRSIVNTNAIGILNRLCNRAEAKIVTNSSHNYFDTQTGDLRADLIRHGIKSEHFHDDWRTKYPYHSKPMYHSRESAILEWQDRNGEVDWICFDDIQFTESNRLMLVDFDRGIDYPLFLRALAYYKVVDNFLTY